MGNITFKIYTFCRVQGIINDEKTRNRFDTVLDKIDEYYDVFLFIHFLDDSIRRELN